MEKKTMGELIKKIRISKCLSIEDILQKMDVPEVFVNKGGDNISFLNCRCNSLVENILDMSIDKILKE